MFTICSADFAGQLKCASEPTLIRTDHWVPREMSLTSNHFWVLCMVYKNVHPSPLPVLVLNRPYFLVAPCPSLVGPFFWWSPFWDANYFVEPQFLFVIRTTSLEYTNAPLEAFKKNASWKGCVLLLNEPTLVRRIIIVHILIMARKRAFINSTSL